MRIWSLHPQYLDTKGLVALWREGLLALHVLRGQTKGYTQHPQLQRFKNHAQPFQAITNYLHAVVDEAERRNFHFNRAKLSPFLDIETISVTSGQIEYEVTHLKGKLFVRDVARFEEMRNIDSYQLHPLFGLIPGQVEMWEKQSTPNVKTPE